MVASRICQFRKPDGSQCGAPPLHEAGFCRMHDPENADAVQEARRLGGLRRRKEVTVAVACELKAVWAEIAAEFEGEDAADPELRARLRQAEADLEALAAKVGRAAKRPPAPDAEGLERVRGLADRAFSLLGLDEKPQQRKTWERPS